MTLTKGQLRTNFAILCLSLSVDSCRTLSGPKPTASPKARVMNGASLAAFPSEQAFQDYMTGLGKTLVEKRRIPKSALPMGKAESSSANSNDTITNNQELGVDEGGLVKNIGDDLVVLRQGRLSAISTANNQLKEIDAIDVPRSPELFSNVWYDELLVKGDRLYVVGFRYQTGSSPNQFNSANDPCVPQHTGATEINSFQLKDGKFVRLQTKFIESFDYYSSQNYASRMVRGRLVFYMPHQAFNYCAQRDQLTMQIPQELTFDKASGFKPVKPLFAGTDVYRNIENIEGGAIFHSIVSCDLPDDGNFECRSKAVLGDYSREKYVTSTQVFLANARKIYAMSLEDLGVRAHAFNGAPLNQFSFKATGDTLKVIVADDVDPQSGVSTSQGDCAIKILSLPLGQFDGSGNQDLTPSTQEVYKGKFCAVGANRFVGDHALVARYIDMSDKQELIAYSSTSKAIRTMPLDGNVGRIEVLADQRAFMAVRRTDGQYEISSMKLDQPELKASSLKLGKVAEGESRSHGFFQKPMGDGTHMIGLPIMTLSPDPAAWWGRGLSNIAIFRLASDDSLKILGKIESGTDKNICKSSCVDWYGNTRPIFLKDRVFGLVGHEMAEVKISGDAVTPVSRVQMFGSRP